MLPNTDGALQLHQGRDWKFTVAVQEGCPPTPVAGVGYELRMQVRTTVESDTVLIDVTDYATSSGTLLAADVNVPAGITAALAVDREYAEWIADAKFVKIGSDPVEATDAGRFTIEFYPEVTR